MARLWQYSEAHPKSAFSKKLQRGDQVKFFKNAEKVALVSKAEKHFDPNDRIRELVCTYSAKTGQDFGGSSGSKTARMETLWQFSLGYPKPAFSKKVQRGDQGKFFKNRPKSSPRLKGPKALWRKWHYPVISMYLKCKDWTRFWRKKRLRMAKLWQFLQGHPKPAFSKNVQRGDQGKFFKNRPKRSPRLKGVKALWRKWHYPLISMHL